MIDIDGPVENAAGELNKPAKALASSRGVEPGREGVSAIVEELSFSNCKSDGSFAGERVRSGRGAVAIGGLGVSTRTCWNIAVMSAVVCNRVAMDEVVLAKFVRGRPSMVVRYNTCTFCSGNAGMLEESVRR